MADEDARQAAVKGALAYVEPGMTLGLGSGRAVFALARAIGAREDAATFTVVGASPDTEAHAHQAGLKVISLADADQIDIALDGADEVDDSLGLIKGGGAALLREKLLSHAADRTVIFCQASKRVTRLGATRPLPVEIVPYGWPWTCARVLDLSSSARLRRTEEGDPVLTAEQDYLLDVEVPPGDLADFAHALTDTLGVVEHGLFLEEADIVVLGHEDGSTETLHRL